VPPSQSDSTLAELRARFGNDAIITPLPPESDDESTD